MSNRAVIRPSLNPMTDLVSGRVGPATPHEIADEHRDLADQALEILLDSSLEPIVDMVLTRRDGAYEALSADGRVRFTSETGLVSVLEEQGANPIENQATDAFSPLGAELAHQHPHRRDNTYPNAYEQIVQLFDAPAAPDLCVLHSARHNWEDQGGHIGEHGSLGVVQARAPWIIAGRGVANLGVVPRAARLVDVAPTIASLLGCAPCEQFGDGRFLSRQDGVVRDDVLVPAERPRHVVGFLFDGANPNVLYAMAAAGEAPNVARLIEMGTAFGHGAMAGLPTVTLANHTSILTGAYPGHHGILNNAWYDRAAQRQVITNSPATWHVAMDNINPGTDSIHSAVRRTWPGNFTLTDAAMHECGPHSEMAAASVRDSDARVGEILAAVERAGVFDETAFVLVADHGMEENDPACTGDWDVALRGAGLQVRDEAYGFLYLGVES